jgi:hypothetical protein
VAFGILARMRGAVAVLAVAALAGGTWATTAVAQDDGVYFDDPDSPGGKEYSIPHERSRRDSGGPGAGGRGGGGGSDGETPRFGVGIEPDGGDGGGGSSGVAGESAAGSDGSGGKGSGARGSDDAAADDGASGGAVAGSGSGTGEVAYRATSSSDTQPELTVSAIALGVLLAGGGLGLLLRRSRRGPAG